MAISRQDTVSKASNSIRANPRLIACRGFMVFSSLKAGSLDGGENRRSASAFIVKNTDP